MNLFKEETPTKCIKYAVRRRINYKGLEIVEWVDPKEITKSTRELIVVKPQTLAQSNNNPYNNSRSLAPEWSASSKVRLFLSRQRVHIKHNGTKSHTWNYAYRTT